jgi:hypothetical protein
MNKIPELSGSRFKVQGSRFKVQGSRFKGFYNEISKKSRVKTPRLNQTPLFR